VERRNRRFRAATGDLGCLYPHAARFRRVLQNADCQRGLLPSSSARSSPQVHSELGVFRLRLLCCDKKHCYGSRKIDCQFSLSRCWFHWLLPLSMSVAETIAECSQTFHYRCAAAKNLFEDCLGVLAGRYVERLRSQFIQGGQSLSGAYALPCSSSICLHTLSKSVRASVMAPSGSVSLRSIALSHN
jgi:hypothetical protein